MAKMRFTSLGLLLASSLAAGLVQAADLATEMKIDLVPSQTALSNGQKDVSLGFQSHEEMNGVCDLILYSFNYDADAESLSLAVRSEEPCLNESYGKRSGATVWRVPKSVIQNSASLIVLINGEKAGVLSVKDGAAAVTPNNSNLNF